MNSDLNYRLRKYLDCLENKERIWRESVDVRKERKDLHIPTQEEYAGVRTLDKKDYVLKYMWGNGLSFYEAKCYVRDFFAAEDGQNSKKDFSFYGNMILVIVLLCMLVLSFAMIGSLDNLSPFWIISFWVSAIAFPIKAFSFIRYDLIPHGAQLKEWRKKERILKKAIESYNIEKEKVECEYRRKLGEYDRVLPKLRSEYGEKCTFLDGRISEIERNEMEYTSMASTYEVSLGIPFCYQSVEEIKKLIKVVSDGRADSIKEAINVLVSDGYLQKQTEYAQQQAEYAKARAAVEYQRLQQEENHRDAVMNVLQELQDRTDVAASDALKSAKKRGETQCYNCRRYWSCSQRRHNDNGMCTAFVPKESYP